MFRVLRYMVLAPLLAWDGPNGATQAQTAEEIDAYIIASARWDMEAMHTMEARFSRSDQPSDRAFGLLISAKIDHREQRMDACMHKLDSVLHYPYEVPAAIRARAFREKCVVNTDLQFYREALKDADSGLAIADSLTEPALYAALLVAKAEAHAELLDFNQAHPLLTQAYQLAEREKDRQWMGASLLVLGNIQFRQGNYTKAMDSYRQAINLVGDPANQISVHAVSNLASASVMDGRYDLAQQILDSLLRSLGPRDPALRFLCMSNSGYISSRQKKYKEALVQYEAALAFADSVGLIEEKGKTLQLLASTLWKMGRREKALDVANKALELARQNKKVHWQVELHHLLGTWEHAMGDDGAAYGHAMSHKALSDSLNKARFNQQLVHADILFDTERREHQIAQQAQALELAAAVDRRKNLQRLALGLAVLAITTIALLLWRSLLRKHKLAEQERRLHLQEVDDLMRRNEINTMQAMLDGQEKERERTARDLHDRLGAMLSTIKMQVGALEDKVELVHQDQRRHYEKVTHLLDEAVGEVRRIAHDMNTVTLSRFGLAKALEDLCDNVRIHGKLDVELTLFGLEDRMDTQREIVIYRIIQELVGNALKHARAKEISVSVTREAGRFSAMVSDDGIGFDPSTAHGGIGLENIRHRAASIGATIRVDSTPGHGTTVSIEGPVLE